jgi:hypothetical protein
MYSLLGPAVEEAGFTPKYPKAEGSEVIHARIVRNLESMDMVLCDLSSLNPNVLFELGVRTAVNKPACLVHDMLTALPFDTGIVNTHTYNPKLYGWDMKEEISRMAGHIRSSAETSANTNPLWKFFGLTTTASMAAADASSSDEKLDFILSEIASIKTVRSRPLGSDGLDRLISTLFFMTHKPTVTINDLTSAVRGLDALANYIITRRFGLDGSGPHTIQDIADGNEMDYETVRKFERVALKSIIDMLNGDPF